MSDAPLLSLGESTAEAVERALQNVYPGASRSTTCSRCGRAT